MDAIHQWVLTAPVDDFWRISITLVLFCLTGFFFGFYYLYRKRIIEDTPTSKIRSAAQGYVELAGNGELLEKESNVAPLTGITCTWYSYSIAERRRSGKRTRWVVIESDTSKADFRLVDETGETIIDPEGADVTPAITDVWYGNSRHPDPDKPGTVSGSLFRAAFKRYRYIEKRLHPGEPLYAIGLFKTTGGSNSVMNINADMRDLISEWKKDSDRMLAGYDQNRDGQIDIREWGKVREAALATVRRRHSELKTLPPVNVMGKTCDKRRPYLLSAVPEPSLVKRYNLYAFAGITVFFVAGVIGSWMIIIRHGS